MYILDCFLRYGSFRFGPYIQPGTGILCEPTYKQLKKDGYLQKINKIILV